jgi:hypothetical protein
MKTTFVEAGSNAGTLKLVVADDAWTAVDAEDFSSLTASALTAKDAFSSVTITNKETTEIYILLRDDGAADTLADDAITLAGGQIVIIPCNQLNNGFPIFSLSFLAEVDGSEIAIDAIFTRRF